MPNLVVWKYPFHGVSAQVPAIAKVLHVDIQRDEMFAWCLLDPDADKGMTKTVVLAGTGHPYPDIDGWTFVNTFMPDNATYVFHAFVDDRTEVSAEQP